MWCTVIEKPCTVPVPYLYCTCTVPVLYHLFSLQAVLGAIVWMAIFSIFKQVKDLWMYMKLSVSDSVRKLWPHTSTCNCSLLLISVLHIWCTYVSLYNEMHMYMYHTCGMYYKVYIVDMSN